MKEIIWVSLPGKGILPFSLQKVLLVCLMIHLHETSFKSKIIRGFT